MPEVSEASHPVLPASKSWQSSSASLVGAAREVASPKKRGRSSGPMAHVACPVAPSAAKSRRSSSMPKGNAHQAASTATKRCRGSPASGTGKAPKVALHKERGRCPGLVEVEASETSWPNAKRQMRSHTPPQEDSHQVATPVVKRPRSSPACVGRKAHEAISPQQRGRHRGPAVREARQATSPIGKRQKRSTVPQAGEVCQAALPAITKRRSISAPVVEEAHESDLYGVEALQSSPFSSPGEPDPRGLLGFLLKSQQQRRQQQQTQQTYFRA